MEDGRQFLPVYFDFVDSKAFASLSGQAIKLYILLRRYVCRARNGHKLSDFYIKGSLATAGYLRQYADRFNVSKQTISRWLNELEEAKFIRTYQVAANNGTFDNPNIWILGMVMHIEGSERSVEVFFADYDAVAQEPDSGTLQTFDQSKGDALCASMPVTESIARSILEISKGTVPNLERGVPSTVPCTVPPKLLSNIEGNIEGNNNKRLTARPAASNSPPAEKDYRKTYYYKDKERVHAIGTVTRGPWAVTCECGSDVTIDTLDGDPVGCLCGMHEFVLVKNKPKAKIKSEHPAVKGYYDIAYSRGVRRGSLPAELEHDIATMVGVEQGAVTRWRLVVKEYIAQGWNANSVLTMLDYYRKGKMPGERQKKDDTPAGNVIQEDEDGSKVLMTSRGEPLPANLKYGGD